MEIVITERVKSKHLAQAREVGDSRYDAKVARAFDCIESGLVLDILVDEKGQVACIDVRSARTAEIYRATHRRDIVVERDPEAGDLLCTCPAGRSHQWCYHRLMSEIVSDLYAEELTSVRGERSLEA